MFFFPARKRWLGLYGIFAILRVVYYLMPFNSGEFVYLAVLKKYKFSPSITETVPTRFFLRVTDVIAISLWFIIVLFLIPFIGSLFGKMYSFRWLIIGIACLMLLIVLSFPFWIPKITINKAGNWFTNKLILFKSGFNRAFGLYTLLKTLLISLAVWFSLIMFDALALLAFNTPLSFLECFLAAIGMYCVSLLPINAPMNLGTDEAIWTGILLIAGVTSFQAISIALSLRFVSIFVLFAEAIFGSLIFFTKNNLASAEKVIYK